MYWKYETLVEEMEWEQVLNNINTLILFRKESNGTIRFINLLKFYKDLLVRLSTGFPAVQDINISPIRLTGKLTVCYIDISCKVLPALLEKLKEDLEKCFEEINEIVTLLNMKENFDVQDYVDTYQDEGYLSYKLKIFYYNVYTHFVFLADVCRAEKESKIINFERNEFNPVDHYLQLDTA